MGVVPAALRDVSSELAAAGMGGDSRTPSWGSSKAADSLASWVLAGWTGMSQSISSTSGSAGRRVSLRQGGEREDFARKS